MHNSNKHNTTSWGSKLGPSVQKDFRDTRTNGKYGYIHGAESDYVGWEERFFNFINSYDELKDDELLHEEELI